MSLSDTDQQWKTHVKMKTDLLNMILVVGIQVLKATLGASYSLQCVWINLGKLDKVMPFTSGNFS